MALRPVVLVGRSGGTPAKSQSPGTGLDGGLPHVDGGGTQKPAWQEPAWRYRVMLPSRAGAEDICTCAGAGTGRGRADPHFFTRSRAWVGVARPRRRVHPLWDEVVIAQDLGNAMPLGAAPVPETAGGLLGLLGCLIGDPDAGQSRQLGGPHPRRGHDIYNVRSRRRFQRDTTGDCRRAAPGGGCMEHLVRTARTALE